MKLIYFLFVYFIVSSSVNSKRTLSTKTCGYESCPLLSKDKINIHLVPHTHDDVGWLKTVDQYYYGSRNSIQKVGVQYILDSVVQELLKDSRRRFIYVESAFFFKWWKEQSKELQEQVKTLVNEGRLEFAGGAWSMNDEATTHYQSIIDQFSWGLRKLNETFGKCSRPRIGWQIDPFGHSREMASIFARMGYDGLFFARIDNEDKNKRKLEKKLELVWHGSKNSLGDVDNLFTGVLYNHYSAPPGFCFDVLCNDEPIIDGKHSPDNNVVRKINDFLEHVQNMAQFYRTKNLIVPMGDDFTYQDANMWYNNIDKLIKYGNTAANNTNFHIFYSTPSCYLKSLYEANISWPTKHFDFFPYSSDLNSYWTGFYTSRPTIKRYERTTNHFLQVCKQLTTMLQIESHIKDVNMESNLNYLREVMGIMQHHDAITGTEKEHVAHDYERLMYESVSMCSENTRKALTKLMNIKNGQFAYQFESCHLLNISACEILESSKNFMVTLYNPLSQMEEQFVRIPVEGGEYAVKDSQGNLAYAEMIPIPDSVRQLPFRFSSATFELIFKAKTIPVKGFDSYFITKKSESESVKQLTIISDGQIKVLSNKNIVITFDDRGFLSMISINGVTNTIHQEFLYYEAGLSGAYRFAPGSDARKITDRVELKVYNGRLIKEVHQKFNDWISQVIRIYETESFVEFEWLVGPIPVEDSMGKEIISRFTTNIKSNDIFETDSNGREMIIRVRDKRESFKPNLQEHIAANYYPVTSKISISDDESRLSILTDRAQGGSSLESGVVELMVHRRLLKDDGFGVGEKLDETAFGRGLVARGKHYLYLGKPTFISRTYERFLQSKIHLPFWTFFNKLESPVIDTSLRYKYLSVFSVPLPINIQLITVEPWGNNQVLLRYENTLEKEDSVKPIQPTIINLKRVFNLINGIELRETTLDGNEWLSDMHRLKFNTESMFRRSAEPLDILHVARNQSDVMKYEDFNVALFPMQIRTFILKYNTSM